MSIKSVMPSNHLILCRPLLLLLSIFPWVLSNELQFFTSRGQSIGVSASTSVLPMNNQDWVPLGWTSLISLQSKSLFQHHSSKASILRHSAFFIVQLSHPYMTTGKREWLPTSVLLLGDFHGWVTLQATIHGIAWVTDWPCLLAFNSLFFQRVKLFGIPE